MIISIGYSCLETFANTTKTVWLIKNHFLLVTQSFRVILRLVNPKIIASFLLIILLASAFQHLGAASRKVP
ncbi:MAG: hypothetical protein VX821_04090, partial [Verrucomicrobiota bacterium]|nr:hypothetical protein [Verrucomicrobiota bacterium]